MAHDPDGRDLAELRPLERNRYYYGKLLDGLLRWFRH